jgi:hypothetical protein
MLKLDNKKQLLFYDQIGGAETLARLYAGVANNLLFVFLGNLNFHVFVYVLLNKIASKLNFFRANECINSEFAGCIYLIVISRCRKSKLLKIIKGLETIVVHTYPALASIFWVNGKKIIFFIHNVSSERLTFLDVAIFKLIFKFLLKRNSIKFVTLSKVNSNDFTRVFGYDCEVVPLPDNLLEDVKPKKDKVKAFVHIANGTKNKGTDLVLLAHHRSGSDVPLYVVGPEKLFDNVIKSRNAIKFVREFSNRKNFLEFLGDKTALVLASESESYSLVVAEALRLNMIVISTKIPAVIEQSEGRVIFYDRNNIQELVDIFNAFKFDI